MAYAQIGISYFKEKKYEYYHFKNIYFGRTSNLQYAKKLSTTENTLKNKMTGLCHFWLEFGRKNKYSECIHKEDSPMPLNTKY